MYTAAEIYAKEFLQFCTDEVLISKIPQLLKFVEQEDVNNYLCASFIKTEEKLKLIDRFIDNEFFIYFILVIAKRKKLYLLKKILTAIIFHHKLSKGIQYAKVTSATKLSEMQKIKLTALIQKIFCCKNAEIENLVDPGLLGGFIIKVQDRMLDACIASQLKLLKTNVKKKINEIIL